MVTILVVVCGISLIAVVLVSWKDSSVVTISSVVVGKGSGESVKNKSE